MVSTTIEFEIDDELLEQISQQADPQLFWNDRTHWNLVLNYLLDLGYEAKKEELEAERHQERLF